MAGGEDDGPSTSVSHSPAVNSPTEFDFTKPESWTVWIKRFDRYLSITGLDKKADADKIDILCYTMGEKSEEILKQIIPDMTAATTFQTVKTQFGRYFNPKKNEIFERYKFNSRTQRENESVDEFITALHTLAETCNYGTLKDGLI